MKFNLLVRYALFTGFLFSPALAYAYIGPGAGLSAIGSFVALIGATLLMIVGFIWYPFKRLLKGKSKKNTSATNQSDDNIKSDSKSHTDQS